MGLKIGTREIVRKKIVEVEDDFYEYMKDMKRKLEYEQKRDLTMPKVSSEILRHIRKMENNGHR